MYSQAVRKGGPLARYGCPFPAFLSYGIPIRQSGDIAINAWVEDPYIKINPNKVALYVAYFLSFAPTLGGFSVLRTATKSR